MSRRSDRVFGLLLTVLLMLACVPTLGPASLPAPTMDPNTINTIIVQTAAAAQTQTALFTTPSATPTPTVTFTPTLTETPTTVPTILIVLASPTAPVQDRQEYGPNGKFGCTILSKTPGDGFGFSAGIEFSVTWQLANSGKAVWDAANADIHYLSGDKMYVQSVYDLDRNVGPNDEYAFSAKMKAPQKNGTYTIIWVMRTKTDEYCRMSITIKV